MTKAEILDAFHSYKGYDPFNWLLDFLKENGIKYTFDSFQTLLISTDDPPALKIYLHQQRRRKHK